MPIVNGLVQRHPNPPQRVARSKQISPLPCVFVQLPQLVKRRVPSRSLAVRLSLGVVASLAASRRQLFCCFETKIWTACSAADEAWIQSV